MIPMKPPTILVVGSGGDFSVHDEALQMVPQIRIGIMDQIPFKTPVSPCNLESVVRIVPYPSGIGILADQSQFPVRLPGIPE